MHPELVEDEFFLSAGLTPLLGLGNRRDEFGAAASINNVVRRLAGGIKLPVARGILVRRVQDRFLKE